MRSKLACVGWKQLLTPAVIACGAALVAADHALASTLRDAAVVVFLAFATLTAVTAVNEYRAATALRTCDPSYTFDGRWPSGFWSWLRNGLEGALQAAEIRAAAEGASPDLLICGPGRGDVSPPLRRTARLVVGVRVGDGIPAAIEPSRFRQLQQRQWHLLLYIARRGTELRAYLVEPGGNFTLIPGGASDDILFAEIRRRILDHLPHAHAQQHAEPASPETEPIPPGAATTADPRGPSPRRAHPETTSRI